MIDDLDLWNITLLGASMGAMIGVLASLQRPERFQALVFIGASPRCLNDQAYLGGFDRADIDGFSHLIDHWQNWQGAVTGMRLSRPVSLALQEMAEQVQGVRPHVAGVVARSISESDDRSLLPQVRHPVLVTQTKSDSAVPVSVTYYLTRQLPQAELVFMPGVGHLPNFMEPDVFNGVVRPFIHRWCAPEVPAPRATDSLGMSPVDPHTRDETSTRH
jgi:sigma-B regulation protein RsbQ